MDLQRGDLVVMKTQRGVLDLDDIWEVFHTDPRVPHLVEIRNVADFRSNSKVGSFTWDVSLVRKLPTRSPENAILQSAF